MIGVVNALVTSDFLRALLQGRLFKKRWTAAEEEVRSLFMEQITMKTLPVKATTEAITAQSVYLKERPWRGVSEQIHNGTSAQFRLFSASNGRWAKKLTPKGFTS